MSAADLIKARQDGATFESILHVVRSGRETVSSLPEDQLEFFESMLTEVKKATAELEGAIKSDNLGEVKRISESFQEIFTMLSDCCEG